MPFVHRLAPAVTPRPRDVCLVIESDRVVAAPDISAAVSLPRFADLLAVVGELTPPLHVGLIDEEPCWLFSPQRSQASLPAPWTWHDSRSLLSTLSPAQSHALSCARQLRWWEQRHRFCGACGTATVDVPEERARRCPGCGALYFPVASPAVIVAVTRGDELLLAHNRNFRAGVYSLLAGFVDPGETLEQAAIREVREEVGVEIDSLQYLASQPWSFPNSLMVGFTARYAGGDIQVDGREIDAAAWFARTSMPEVPRRGTVARELIDRWVSRSV